MAAFDPKAEIPGFMGSRPSQRHAMNDQPKARGCRLWALLRRRSTAPNTAAVGSNADMNHHFPQRVSTELADRLVYPGFSWSSPSRQEIILAAAAVIASLSAVARPCRSDRAQRSENAMNKYFALAALIFSVSPAYAGEVAEFQAASINLEPF
jgi:hypothetical protein